MARQHSPILLLLGSLLPLAGATSSSLVGVNYGLLGDNLLPPDKISPLLRSINVGRIKLYSSDPSLLQAFSHTGIDLTISLPDRCIPLISDPSQALSWLRSHVLPFLPNTKISSIAVGNEVLSSPSNNNNNISHSLLPAMQSLHSALLSLSLHRQISVTTAHSIAILSSSYPPSSARFRPDLLPLLLPLLRFLSQTNSPLLINAYPYFAYNSDPGNVSLPYALFEDNPGVVDPNTGFNYTNMLDAQIDAVYAAVADARGAEGLEVRVSETGWPSGGDADETGATPENAAKYNGNLMRLVGEEKGTPMRPGVPRRVYVFALFNENLKPGPASERNYGLFKPDGTPAYSLGIQFPTENSTVSPPEGGFHGAGGGGGDSSGYYDISSAMERWRWLQRAVTTTTASVTAAIFSFYLSEF